MRTTVLKICLLSLMVSIGQSCETTTATKNEKLPIIPRINKETGEPEQHTIREFSFTNQDNQEVNNATFENKLYVANEFFIHCPTICPKVIGNLKYLYDELEGNDDVLILSHAIDTKRDTVGALKVFADKLEIESSRWHMVTGDKTKMYEIINEDYLGSAKEDDTVDGGYDHSGYLVLVDKKGQVRSFARGTEREATDQLIEDIKRLLKE